MNYTITSQGPFEVHVVSGGGSGNSGKPIAKISLEKCKWQKNLNQLSVSWSSNFPAEVIIHNPKTNDHRTYVHLTENDPRFDQDQWDGEQMVYKTNTKTNNAEYLVLYRGS
jgi:hypothetical protein